MYLSDRAFSFQDNDFTLTLFKSNAPAKCCFKLTALWLILIEHCEFIPELNYHFSIQKKLLILYWFFSGFSKNLKFFWNYFLYLYIDILFFFTFWNFLSNCWFSSISTKMKDNASLQKKSFPKKTFLSMKNLIFGAHL